MDIDDETMAKVRETIGSQVTADMQRAVRSAMASLAILRSTGRAGAALEMLVKMGREMPVVVLTTSEPPSLEIYNQKGDLSYSLSGEKAESTLAKVAKLQETRPEWTTRDIILGVYMELVLQAIAKV